MKIALVHDYIKEYGGAERVLEALQEIWPGAPIYTLVYLPKFLGPHQKRVKNWRIKPLIPSWLPLLRKMISPLRLVAPFFFRRLDLSEFDLVIVSATGAYNPNLIKTKLGAHICYCHTPPRYLYGLPTAREWKKHWFIRIPAEIANHFLRMIDYKSAQKVDYFIANSKNTAERIKKFYRRKAIVIYPPVEISEKFNSPPRCTAGGTSNVPAAFDCGATSPRRCDSYFLAGGRLARAKRIDLAIKACTRLNLPLKVFGRIVAGYREELKKIPNTPPSPKLRRAGKYPAFAEATAGRQIPKIEFLGEVSEEEKFKLFANCKAFIFPAEEEDFGIMPVEAMAAGKPVIALRQGGVIESVIEGKTGEFFEKATVESLVQVLKKFEPKKYKPEDCRKQAKKFNEERFIQQITLLVSSIFATKNVV